MSDEKRISRRASLRGIAATGALIGGASLGVGTASAGEEEQPPADAVKKVTFEDCHSVAVQLKKGHDEVPIRIRAYNERLNRIENIEQTISADHVVPYEVWKTTYDEKDDTKYHDEDDKKGHDEDDKNESKDSKKKGKDNKKKDEKSYEWLCEDDSHDKDEYADNYDGKHVWPFSLYQFYDRSIDSKNKLLSVKIGDKRFENPNCGKKYRHSYDKKGDIDPDDLRLVAICVNSKKNTARFRVDNANKKKVTVEYDVFGTDRDGKVTIEPKSTTYFDVEASGSGGQATVRLFYDDEQIDVKASNTQKECAPKLLVNSYRTDLSKRKVRFTIGDSSDVDRTFHYYVTETGEAGTVTISDSVSNKKSFWVTAPKGKATVKLYYQGYVVGKATNDFDISDPVFNITTGKSYETIQEAVDSASEGDTIVVCEDEELDSTVEIDVPDLTLKGVKKPTIDGSGNSPVLNITADGVTVTGLGITNPDELLGIRIGEGVDGATIRENHLFEIGPTGRLGVTGILVAPGDHENIWIDDNTIEDLEQTDDGSFATLNGILFDADDEDQTLTDSTVKDNKIQNLDSTTGSLGIVVQHNVDGLSIKDNRIKNVVADNDFGPGSFTTFAQGISIDSPETADFDIYDNTIKEIESNDGFFGEAIKIESQVDVAEIKIRKNNLLAAIGVNNADGDNPDVNAKQNYWGDSDGPIVIESNDDDGDVSTPDDGDVDLDTVDASAVTENVEFEPFKTSKL